MQVKYLLFLQIDIKTLIFTNYLTELRIFYMFSCIGDFNLSATINTNLSSDIFML